MKRVYVCICITALMFGSMEVALKLGGGKIDSFQLTFLRFFIGGMLLLPMAIAELKKNNIRLHIKDFAWLTLLGIICVPLCMLAFQAGVMKANAGTAAVILSSNPIFTMIFAHFISDESFTKGKLKVLIIGVIGIIFMIRPWDMQPGNTITGLGLVLFAAIMFGLYTVLGKDMNKKIGIFAQSAFSFLIGSFILLIVIIIMGKPITEGITENIPIIFYASVCVTALGYYSFFIAIKYSDAATGSIAFFLKIVIAPILALIVLGEGFTWNMYIGIACMLAASFMNIKEGLWKRFSGKGSDIRK